MPVQLDCTEGEVTIGFDGDPSTTTGSCGQPVSALGLESTGNGYTATFQTDGSPGSAPTALVVVGGGIPTVGEDFSSGSNGEGTIPMGKAVGADRVEPSAWKEAVFPLPVLSRPRAVTG